MRLPALSSQSTQPGVPFRTLGEPAMGGGAADPEQLGPAASTTSCRPAPGHTIAARTARSARRSPRPAAGLPARGSTAARPAGASGAQVRIMFCVTNPRSCRRSTTIRDAPFIGVRAQSSETGTASNRGLGFSPYMAEPEVVLCLRHDTGPKGTAARAFDPANKNVGRCTAPRAADRGVHFPEGGERRLAASPA